MKMDGYKGFNDKLQCIPDGKTFQFEVGKEYEHDGLVKWCKSGFHFCENPLAVFSYYPPTDRFAKIEADGVLDQTDESTKRVAKKMKISAELSLSALIGAGVKFILEKVDFKNAKESNTGDSSAATNTGNSSAATNTGDSSAATNTGKYGTSISLGIEGRASGSIGNFLVLAEWEYKDLTWKRIAMGLAKVDGKKIKADTFYVLKGGKFIEFE